MGEPIEFPGPRVCEAVLVVELLHYAGQVLRKMPVENTQAVADRLQILGLASTEALPAHSIEFLLNGFAYVIEEWLSGPGDVPWVR